MEHSFDIEIAQKYGMNAAVIYKNFQFWIAKNKANNKNCHEGRTWTYNSLRALVDLFPYMSVWNVRKALRILIDGEILIKGNFNKNGYDQTDWFAFKDEKAVLKGYPSHLWDSQMGETKQKRVCETPELSCETPESVCEIHTTIPNPKPNSKPNKKPNPIGLKKSSEEILELDLKINQEKNLFMQEIQRLFKPNRREAVTFARITSHLVYLVQQGERDVGIFQAAIKWGRWAKTSTVNSPPALFVSKIKQETNFLPQKKLLNSTKSRGVGARK